VTVLVREAREERVWAARPKRLVAETPAGAVLGFPHGTRWRGPTTPDGRPSPFDANFEDWPPDWPALVLQEGREDACR
jgi:hypothetical protein